MGGCPRAAGTALLPERRAAAPAGLGSADPGPSGCDRCRACPFSRQAFSKPLWKKCDHGFDH